MKKTQRSVDDVVFFRPMMGKMKLIHSILQSQILASDRLPSEKIHPSTPTCEANCLKLSFEIHTGCNECKIEYSFLPLPVPILLIKNNSAECCQQLQTYRYIQS